MGAGAAGGRTHRSRPDMHPGRKRLRLGVAADHRARRARGDPHRRPSCWSSDGRPSRCCRRGCSVTACSASPAPSASSWGLPCSDRSPICRCSSRSCSAPAPPARGCRSCPLMGGLLITSIASGQLISRTGHYRPFPIAGTAIMVVRAVPALHDGPAHEPRDGIGVHVRAGPGAGLDDAGARPGGAERRRLQGPRRGHLRGDAVSLDRWLGRDRRAGLDLLQPAGRGAGHDASALAPATRWAPARASTRRH